MADASHKARASRSLTRTDRFTVAIGLAGIDFAALVFLLIGESEDRDHAERTR